MSQNGVEPLLRLLSVDRASVRIDASGGSREPGRFDDLLRQVDSRQASSRPAYEASRPKSPLEAARPTAEPPRGDARAVERDDRRSEASRREARDATERPGVDDGSAARPEAGVDHARVKKERDEQDQVDAEEGPQETVAAASPEPTAESAESGQAADVKAKLEAGMEGNKQQDQAAVDQTEGDAESARSVSTAASDAPGSTTAGIADAPSETEDSANSSGHAGGTANPQVEKAGHVDVNGEADGESSDGETERTVDGTAPQLASGFTEEAGASEDGDGTPASETPRGEKGTESGDSASDRRTDRSRSTAGQSPRGTRSSDPANVRQMTANPTDSQGASPQATSLQGVTTLGENGSAGGTPDPPGGPSSAGSTRSAVQPVGTLLRSEATRMQAPVSGNAAPDTAAGNVDHVRFVQRVARALQMGRSQQGELQLRLSPPELGRLNLEVSIKQGVLTARLEAETDAARSLILDNLPALRDRLSEQNIRIERFHVDLMAPSSDGSQGQVDYRDARQGEQGQRPTGGERRVDREADPRPTAQRGIPDIDGNLNVIV